MLDFCAEVSEEHPYAKGELDEEFILAVYLVSVALSSGAAHPRDVYDARVTPEQHQRQARRWVKMAYSHGILPYFPDKKEILSVADKMLDYYLTSVQSIIYKAQKYRKDLVKQALHGIQPEPLEPVGEDWGWESSKVRALERFWREAKAHWGESVEADTSSRGLVFVSVPHTDEETFGTLSGLAHRLLDVGLEATVIYGGSKAEVVIKDGE